MQSCRGAIAKKPDVARPLFQHEREILRPHELRMVGVNEIESHDGTGDFHGQRRFGWMVDDHGIQPSEYDRRSCPILQSAHCGNRETPQPEHGVDVGLKVRPPVPTENDLIGENVDMLVADAMMGAVAPSLTELSCCFSVVPR